jgi:hypothetical protein
MANMAQAKVASGIIPPRHRITTVSAAIMPHRAALRL